jgi:hypothetical protein
MRLFFSILVSAGITSFSFFSMAKNSISSTSEHSCELQIYSLGAAESSPLQTEAEWILSLKGYKLTHRSSVDFYKADLDSEKMYATYRVGASGLKSQSDCISQHFEDLGKFYTCSYELTLYFYSLSQADFVAAVQIKAAIRDARGTEGFYDSVYNQLKSLPFCL